MAIKPNVRDVRPINVYVHPELLPVTSATLSTSSHSPKAGSGFPHSHSSPHELEQTLDSISRLIGETAHDLRAPLSTIREAVRLVHDGELGELTSEQRECLSAAINQCNCVGQLVDEMVQSRHEAAGNVRPILDWTDIDAVRRDVVSTLQPFVMPREIHLLWDGPFNRRVKVYADATILRRLLVNLVGNAVRVTREGQPVLIRAVADRRRGRMTWAVVDQGRGISEGDLERIAAGQAPHSSRGGLGLLICRQLAAAHCSSLRIESRVGTGTAVSFDTAFGGPIDVARHWANWRVDFFKHPNDATVDKAQQKHELLRNSSASSISPPRRVRIDVPSQRVEVRARNSAPEFSGQVFVASVTLGATLPAEAVDGFDRLLHRSLGPMEFTYRTGDRDWMILWDADREAAKQKRSNLETESRRQFDGIRMNWSMDSEYRFRPDDGGSLTRFLGDVLTRRTLMNSQRAAESSPGRELELSTETRSRAEERLQHECRRLGVGR
ncbi:MAG: HAMP domain-containing sensor histidine kinase [Planctomycetota bacterium]